jgi:hypothetical protein
VTHPIDVDWLCTHNRPSHRMGKAKKGSAGPSPLETALAELHACREELLTERRKSLELSKQLNSLRRQWAAEKPAAEARAVAAECQLESINEEVALERQRRQLAESRLEFVMEEADVLRVENRKLSERCSALAVGLAESEGRVIEAKNQAEEELLMAQKAMEGAFGAALTETVDAVSRSRESGSNRRVRDLEKRLKSNQTELQAVAAAQEAVVSRCEAAVASQRRAIREKELAEQQRDMIQRRFSELESALRTIDMAAAVIEHDGAASTLKHSASSTVIAKVASVAKRYLEEGELPHETPTIVPREPRQYASPEPFFKIPSPLERKSPSSPGSSPTQSKPLFSRALAGLAIDSVGDEDPVAVHPSSAIGKHSSRPQSAVAGRGRPPNRPQSAVSSANKVRPSSLKITSDTGSGQLPALVTAQDDSLIGALLPRGTTPEPHQRRNSRPASATVRQFEPASWTKDIESRGRTKTDDPRRTTTPMAATPSDGSSAGAWSMRRPAASQRPASAKPGPTQPLLIHSTAKASQRQPRGSLATGRAPLRPLLPPSRQVLTASNLTIAPKRLMHE